jgi:hypothetical protein
MKKTLLLLFFLANSLFVFSQSDLYYLKPNRIEAQKFNGTLVSFDSIVDNLGLDPLYCFYGASISDFYGSFALPGMYVYNDSVHNNVGVFTAQRIAAEYDTNQNVLYPVVYGKAESNALFLKITDTTGKWQKAGTYLSPTRTITINGDTKDLSANRTWTLTTSNITEGSNLYWTQARVDAAFAAKSTSNLVEGTNLYWTQARFNTAFAAKSTTDLTEGTNLYFTNARARTAITLTTTGTSGAATYSSSTGVLNVPNYSTAARSFSNTPARSIVTVAAAANGFQPSSTRDASVRYSVTIVTTATIGGASSGTVVLEIAATNSTTAGDWQEVARVTNGQAITLAVALQSVQTISGELHCIVPAGYFVRMRSINTSGTPSFTYNSGQEVQL